MRKKCCILPVRLQCGCKAQALQLLLNTNIMALEEFEKEQMSDREKNLVRTKSVINYAMGVFFIGAGFFFMFPTAKTARFINKYDPSMIQLLAIVCWVYGLFRLYRGYAKNYFRD